MADLKDKKILIVGGAGFVGSNLCLRLLREEPRSVIIVDNLLSSHIDNVPDNENVQFVFGSIADDRILAKIPHDIEYVFHLACYHGNQSSIADPIADHHNNTLTSLKLFDHLKDFPNLQKVVYAAAGCAVAEKTYDDAKPTEENAPISLFHDSPYSISKIIGEFYGNYYYLRYKLPFVKARFQNVYGPREILGAGRWRGTLHTVWRNVIPTFVWRALQKMPLTLDNGGETSRDFIFVEDMAEGLFRCAVYGSAGEVYNLGSGRETKIRDLANLINELTDNPTPVTLLPPRDWDRSGRRFASTEKADRLLGFSAQTEIREGIQKTIDWTVQNRSRIESSIAQHAYFMSHLLK
ncbi:NAD-dependent epimerase/dehydratase family protein [Turneriella parva]|uniref:NAD-dependent epimerase/dehydratase n=1 Tax=Turneriella parva (strain ATCC BAA-1111 / DSM 21527 / NCTC 11395 / H) TaxID=869212 RepID=I4B122_TURPD|nr:NAD-dependent epimerase/dehydratase family protein [Turneriella parva]AFM10979.1 NAD-dependent epimerase/dehydratase [Turneriella parva DSM 21527]